MDYPGAAWLVDEILPWAFTRDILVGPYGVISMAFSYAFALILPIVATFFLAFGLLEDSGYLPRLSVLLDRVFRLMGLNGRAVLPMILGLGCDTMATMTTRILDTKKERMIVTLLLALTVPCSAQLAVILGMAAGLSPKVLGVWLFVLGGNNLGHGVGGVQTSCRGPVRPF
jgi:ferrous iron transport protein B